MVAMDVVDTLRHREELVKRELDSEDRRSRLVKKLQDIYAAQGITVTEDILKEGVLALEEDRFSYKPPKKTLAVRLARLYIKRGRFKKPLLFFAIFLTISSCSHLFNEVIPNYRFNTQVPQSIEQVYSDLAVSAKGDKAKQQADRLKAAALLAVDQGDRKSAESHLAQLKATLAQVNQTYDVYIVSRPNEPSGVYRIPDVNTLAKNYYLIVEAFDSSNKALTLSVLSEESGRTKNVYTWGLRVSQKTYNAVAADKKDDGIIQNRQIGRKVRGYLSPNYTIDTFGGMIYEW